MESKTKVKLTKPKKAKNRSNFPLVAETPAFCVNCGHEYKDRYQLTKHYKKMGKFHDGRCGICEEKFDNWNEHKKHVDLVHDGKFRYRCGFCDETFLGIYNFHAHTRGTTNPCLKRYEACKEMSVFCSTCGLTYADNDSLNAHISAAHTNKPGAFECEECDKVFSNKITLRSHKQNFHDPVTCDQCGKYFKSKKAHRNHVMSHHTKAEEKPYRCTQCPSGFVQPKDLRSHMNSHTGEKPFKCKFCDVKFAQPSSVLRHQKSVHLGIKRPSGWKNKLKVQPQE